MSMEMLTSWLNSPFILHVLGTDLAEAIKHFQMSLISKQSYLAQYIRKDVTMSADAMTTSPVESMNDLIKNKQKINASLNLSKSLEQIVGNQKTRYDRSHGKACMQLNRTQLSSRAPTKDHIHKRCQDMMDFLYDKSSRVKCAMTSECEWMCWNFVDPEKRSKFHDSWQVEDDDFDMELAMEDIDIPDSATKLSTYDEDKLLTTLTLPAFLNVYHVRVSTFEGRLFMKCSCCYYER